VGEVAIGVWPFFARKFGSKVAYYLPRIHPSSPQVLSFFTRPKNILVLFNAIQLSRDF